MSKYNSWGTRELIEELEKRDSKDEGFHSCLRLHRDDFRGGTTSWDASELTESDLSDIAESIGEACMEQFWYSLEFHAEERGLKEITE